MKAKKTKKIAVVGKLKGKKPVVSGKLKKGK